ncbi:Ferredoxin [Sporotomaculum syntrophicum]|uniref:Ferredoxin n=1 Tax=Sporotomaculum syntrophicum TaxID=182264 RepID=A0A9D3AYE8_9FIRM|nr:ferredoxin [Sporotomaculum syntrophicum]KAF1085361.1 Ferredoxin [Sporotomaculum syntrophicum]
MHAEVDQDLCISCGACIDTCPDVFSWNNDEKAHSIVDEVPSDLEDLASEAADGCPTEAISVN